jgi:hypothetical protein
MSNITILYCYIFEIIIYNYIKVELVIDNFKYYYLNIHFLILLLYLIK